MTNAGLPRLVPVHFGVFWPKKAKNTETDWDDNLGKPMLVIPVRFGFFWPKRTKNPKWIGMTTLGSTSLSSNPFRGFLAEKGQQKRETDWDDNPGKPRLVIPVRFGVFWTKRAKKP